jgi:hypothetical protein
VEHVEEKENDTTENDDVDHEHQFDVNDNYFVPPSPPISQQQSHSIAADHPRRTIAPRKRLIEECNIVHYAMSCAELVENDPEPTTYTEAIASIERQKYISAIQKEMQSLEKNGTWYVVHLPKHKKDVCCKWIFKRKEGLSPKEPVWFKARLVGKGFNQILGIDYSDVFSLVVKHSSIRAFFGIVGMLELELEQLDMKTAFFAW